MASADEIAERIKSIIVEMGKKNVELMTKLWDQQAKIRKLHREMGDADPKVIGEAYGQFFDIKRQMIESMIEAHVQGKAVLTEEQRAKFRELRAQLHDRGKSRKMQ